MPFLVVVGHTNLDVQLQLGHFPGPGKSSPVQSRRTVYGGTACNIAAHAAGLGVPTRLWSRVGADMPPDWRGRLEEAGVETAFQEDGKGTPTCFVLTDADGEQAYLMDQAAMTPPYTVPTSVLRDVEWLHIATGDPQAYLGLAKEAKREGIKVALDPGQEIHFAYDEESFRALLGESDALFCNQGEAEVAMGFMDYADPVQFLEHVDTLVITRGRRGVSLYREEGHVHLDAPSVQVVDPTGAGDALRSGWYAALHQGRNRKEALAVGQRAAAACIRFAGPQAHFIQWTDLRP